MTKKTYTRTATFLFPLLGIYKSLFYFDEAVKGKTLRGSLFYNAYLSVVGHVSRDKGVVYVLLQDELNPKAAKRLIEVLASYKNYREQFKARGYTVLVFVVLDPFMRDYELILEGKYSLVSNAGKNLIFQNHFFSGKPHVLPLIMNKSSALKVAWEERLDAQINNQEVWPVFQKQKEILRLSRLKNSIKNKDYRRTRRCKKKK